MDQIWMAMSLLIAAHVLYGLPSSSDSRVWLLNGDDFSFADKPPRPDRLVNVRAVNNGIVTPLRVEGNADTGVWVDCSGLQSPAWVVVETAPTSIELAADKFHRYLAHEGLQQVAATRTEAGLALESGRELYSKHVKTAVSADGGRAHLPTIPVGLPVEIVPMTATIGTADVLTGRVLLDGVPSAGWQVTVHHKASESEPPRLVANLRTDANGEFQVRIDAPGLWRLHTIAMRTHDQPAVADWRSLWACVNFRL